MYWLCVCVCVSEVWERKPLYLGRHKPHYNDGWFSTSELDRILREVHVSTCICIPVCLLQCVLVFYTQ